MELFGVRLVGFNPDTLAELFDRAEAIALAAAREATDDAVRDARRELERFRHQYPLQPADLEPQSRYLGGRAPRPGGPDPARPSESQ